MIEYLTTHDIPNHGILFIGEVKLPHKLSIHFDNSDVWREGVEMEKYSVAYFSDQSVVYKPEILDHIYMTNIPAGGFTKVGEFYIRTTYLPYERCFGTDEPNVKDVTEK